MRVVASLAVAALFADGFAVSFLLKVKLEGELRPIYCLCGRLSALSPISIISPRSLAAVHMDPNDW